MEHHQVPRRAQVPFKTSLNSLSDFRLNLLEMLAPGLMVGLKLSDFDRFVYQAGQTEQLGMEGIGCVLVEELMPTASQKRRGRIA